MGCAMTIENIDRVIQGLSFNYAIRVMKLYKFIARILYADVKVITSMLDNMLRSAKAVTI